MKTEIKIPSLGESVTEVGIATLLKPNGSLVKRDEEIVEIETEKVNQVLNAPVDGILNLNVKVGDKVAVGSVIGFVDSEGTSAPVQEPKKEVKQEPIQAVNPVKASSETRSKMSNVRKAIGDRLSEAQKKAVILTTFNEIDMTQVMELRSHYKEAFEKKHGVRLGLMSFFAKAVVEALKAIPRLNSFIDGDEIVENHTYDIGIAVGTEKGVMVPVIRDCNLLSLPMIEKELLNYADKAKKGIISADELQGGSFTITNGGVYGSLLSTPILNPPQSGILGMHKIEKRAVVINDQIVIRQMMYVALSYDHRIVDGKEAITFLVNIKEHLEDPSRFLLEI